MMIASQEPHRLRRRLRRVLKAPVGHYDPVGVGQVLLRTYRAEDEHCSEVKLSRCLTHLEAKLCGKDDRRSVVRGMPSTAPGSTLKLNCNVPGSVSDRDRVVPAGVVACGTKELFLFRGQCGSQERF